MTKTSDRQFAKDVGIATSCEMCDLLHVDIQRQREETGHRESIIWSLLQLTIRQNQSVRMWQLATFAAVMFGVLMAICSLRGKS